MSAAEIIPFDFEEQAVRVVMRDDEPWFVAADVCRVLELENPSATLKRLDDDEVTLNTIEGSHRPTNLINESGLYALVLTSRKEQAKRFRKWITAEVLPAIRRTGRYEHISAQSVQPEVGQIAGLPIREAELWLQMVREARLTRGTSAALSIWGRSPLPQIGNSPVAVTQQDGQGALDHLLQLAGHMIFHPGDGSVLTDAGLRIREEGLFVANFPLQIFEGTNWGGGAHRAALLSLPGVAPHHGPLSLGRVATRGVIVPWALIGGEVK